MTPNDINISMYDSVEKNLNEVEKNIAICTLIVYLAGEDKDAQMRMMDQLICAVKVSGLKHGLNNSDN